MHEWITQQELGTRFGVVIPVYFTPETDNALVQRLLLMTLQDSSAYLPWEHVWLVVDGDGRAAGILKELRTSLGSYNIIHEPSNRGKLWVVRRAMQAALSSESGLDYLVTRDCDGDHAASDLPALVRAAELLRQQTGSTATLVIGARRSRERPMGWLRGQLEQLLDQITVDALQYVLARCGRTMNLSLCALPGTIDINSGYKVYGRELARALFVNGEPHFAAIAPDDYWHYGPETCPVVEAVLGGALLAEVPRITWDGQPTTSFGGFNPTRLYGCMLTWLFTRLEIPLVVGAQWFDNHAAHLALRLTAEGRQVLDALRLFTLEQTARHQGLPLPSIEHTVTLPFV